MKTEVVASWPLYLINTNIDEFLEEGSDTSQNLVEPFQIGRQLRHIESLEPNESYTEDLLLEFDFLQGGNATVASQLFPLKAKDSSITGVRWKVSQQELEIWHRPRTAHYAHPALDSLRYPAAPAQLTAQAERPLATSPLAGDAAKRVHRPEGDHSTSRHQPSPLSDAAASSSAPRIHYLAAKRERGEYNTVLLRRVVIPGQGTAFVLVPVHAVLHMLPSGLVDPSTSGSLQGGEPLSDHRDVPVEVDIVFRRSEQSKTTNASDLLTSQRRLLAGADPWVLVRYESTANEVNIEGIRPEQLEALSNAPQARFLQRAELRDRFAPTAAQRCFVSEKYQIDSETLGRGIVLAMDRWTGGLEHLGPSSPQLRKADRLHAISDYIVKLLRHAQVVPFERLYSVVNARFPCEETELVDILADQTFLVRGALVLDSEIFFNAPAEGSQSFRQLSATSERDELVMVRNLVLALFDEAQPDGTVTLMELAMLRGRTTPKRLARIMNGLARTGARGAFQFLVKRCNDLGEKFPDTASRLSARLRGAAELARARIFLGNNCSRTHIRTQAKATMTAGDRERRPGAKRRRT